MDEQTIKWTNKQLNGRTNERINHRKCGIHCIFSFVVLSASGVYYLILLPGARVWLPQPLHPQLFLYVIWTSLVCKSTLDLRQAFAFALGPALFCISMDNNEHPACTAHTSKNGTCAGSCTCPSLPARSLTPCGIHRLTNTYAHLAEAGSLALLSPDSITWKHPAYDV
jgi:hypothetical protein